MYAFVKVTGGIGRAFEKHCEDLGMTPGDALAAMVVNFVAAKNMPLPEPEPMGTGLDKLTNVYLKMRDTKSALKKLHETEANAITEQIDRIAGSLLGTLNEAGAKSMRTDSATFYKEKVFKPSCQDWDAFYTFIKDEDAFHFLERRVTKKAVEDYMEETGSLPPGVSALTEYEVRVRRGKDS